MNNMDRSVDKASVMSLLDNDAILEQLMCNIENCIENDDEPFAKKARNLLLSYLENPVLTDNILMSLTGYNLSSLLYDTESD